MGEAEGDPLVDTGRSIHARLLAGDPTASVDLAEHYLEPLAEWLHRHNPRVHDPHLYTVAAGEAIIALIKAPRSYDPTRRSLLGYLRMSAQGDLRNLLRAERRHSSRRADLELVELSPTVGNSVWANANDPSQGMEEPAEPGMALLPGLTPEEAQVLTLMHAGERKTIAYALALGLAHLPFAEQRQRVKRVKDRLQKRLSRQER